MAGRDRLNFGFTGKVNNDGIETAERFRIGLDGPVRRRVITDAASARYIENASGIAGRAMIVIRRIRIAVRCHILRHGTIVMVYWSSFFRHLAVPGHELFGMLSGWYADARHDQKSRQDGNYAVCMCAFLHRLFQIRKMKTEDIENYCTETLPFIESHNSTHLTENIIKS